MKMSMELILTLLNICATLIGGLSFVLYVDRRLTTLETHMIHLLRK